MKVTLKLATSLDGRIATASGESKWITGEAAREQGHKLRAMHQAVLVGVETAIADDPELTVRLPGYMGWQPLRVVLDSNGRLPADSRLVQSAKRHRTAVVTTCTALPALQAAGVAVLTVPAVEGRCDVRAVMPVLGEHLAEQAGALGAAVREAAQDALGAGFRPAPSAFADYGDGAAVMIEGGGQVAASFLSAGLVDAIEWFRAPIVLGDEGRPAVGDFVLEHLSDAPRFRRIDVQALGEDLWERYEQA